MIGDELIDFQYEVLVAIDTGKWTSLNACIIRQVVDEMSCAFIDNALHAKLPGGEVHVFNLKQDTRISGVSITVIF